MMTHCLRTAFRAGAFLFVIGGLACQKSDVVAPDKSTITLNATPSTIILAGGVQSVDVAIVATVANNIGVPLPGQDVRFSTTSGTLDPVGGSPVRTDRFGNATTILTEARQNATITARSGSTMATLTLNTASCQLGNIAISPSPVTFNNCTSSVTVTATATDTGGNPCPGVFLTFAQIATSTPMTDVSLQFVPGSITTDADGEATTELSPASNNDCQTKCGGTNSCTGQFRASSGSVNSNPPTQILDSVP